MGSVMRVTPMTLHERKVALFTRRVTTGTLAGLAGCSPSMVRAVIRGVEKSYRIRKLVARAMGVSVKRAFG